ncbi:hypothetical protein LR48_Vigan393s000900 [Vigna angularis]|uniref:O-fucosyltransferase family protein n=1 Tax=Phaseolus angularis TaxID=3914 RepID=A0A0L9T8X9_PHAAN|nr:hypothetical protein LR48_Vigan393s000900 [Vigna angularis]
MLSKRKPLYRFPFIPVSVLVICLSFLLLFYYYAKPSSQISRLSNISTSHTPQCSSQALTLGEKFMWYAPHSGFSNQLSEFKNAILMAGILNRTLVVPPIMDHHAIALGSCPKFRVVDPKDIRISVWDHVIELVQSRRYISIAEIVDITSLVSSSLVRVIDLRDFVSIWCGISLDLACVTDTKLHSSVSKSLNQCGSLLAGLHGSIEKCIYAVNEDCRTTVWTYNEDGLGDGSCPKFRVVDPKDIRISVWDHVIELVQSRSENHKYKLYFLKANDKLIKRAAIKLMTAGHGQRFLSNSYSTIGKKYCSSQRLPDLLLYVEQTVCSCASLGFVGTPGSTIAENIELMRKFSSSSQRC